MWCGGCLASVSFPSSKCLTSIHYQIEHDVRQCVTERKDKQTHTHTHRVKCTQIAGVGAETAASELHSAHVGHRLSFWRFPQPELPLSHKIKEQKHYAACRFGFFNCQIKYLVRYGQLKLWVVNELERGIKRLQEWEETKGQAREGEQKLKWGSMMGISQEVL